MHHHDYPRFVQIQTRERELDARLRAELLQRGIPSRSGAGQALRARFAAWRSLF